MDIDTLHSDLRKRLDVLGFNHPLPLGAIGIVSAILDDLIKTSEKLKASKQQISQLHQEKAAWELGVEPYKCDNSRLLAECNELHLELVKQRDKFVLANTELKCRVRNLQTDKKQLEERCLQVEAKIRQMQFGDSKSKKDGVNMQRKPFVSTVRPGQYQSSTCCGVEKRESKCCCPCNQARKTDILHEIERLQVETKNQEEVIEAYKKQVDYRDREIQRLGALFAGGRPAAALAKDCCYRNVNTLSEDVKSLQEEKASMQNKLGEALESQQSASKKIQKLSERNKQLEQELKEIENVALSVESEANLNILDKDRQNSDLQIRLQRSNMRIKELETLLEARTTGLTPTSSSASACSLDSTLQNALKQANEEKRALYKQLNELKQREQTFLTDYEKIKSKYSKLKLKLSNQIAYSAADCGRDNSELTELKQKCSTLEDSLKLVESKRDQLSNEIKHLRENVSTLKGESIDKDLRIAQLESELCLQKKTTFTNVAAPAPARLRTADSAISGHTSLSVQSAFHRVERERDAARREVQQLEIERDSLRNKLKLATKSQMDEQANHEEAIIGYSSQIAKLEAEKRDLLCGKSSSQTTLHFLKEENRDLQARLKDVESNFNKLKVSHSQLRILQEQTERAMMQHQNRLLCSENQLDNAEAKLNQVDGTIDCAQKDIGKLRGDISVLKASNASLQREKDKLLMELDKKTEKLYTVEAELNNIKMKKSEMRDTIDRLEKKLENASVDNIEKDSTLRSVATETDTLRKQVATLKRSHDNAVAENGRLSNDLSDTASELTLTKRKLTDCQKEVERMKSQLREYVQEIQRAEELLCIKEREREEMLEHYKSLSEGVNMLEVSNHTLEVESAEAKKLLQEAEGRINGLQEQVGLRQAEVKRYEGQINGLSVTIVSLESEIECLKEENHHLREDLEATKELCNKLDLQKDKLNAELEEHSNIREQLNKENETLKRHLLLSKTGDKAAVDGLQELLAASRSEVEQQRMVTNQLNQEVKTLKEQVEELSIKLDEEQRNAARCEALANEYSVQLHELRRMITEDRFAQVQSREEEDYNRIKPYLKPEEFNEQSSSQSKHSSVLGTLRSESSEIPHSLHFTERLTMAIRNMDQGSSDSSFKGSCSGGFVEIANTVPNSDCQEIIDRYQMVHKSDEVGLDKITPSPLIVLHEQQNVSDHSLSDAISMEQNELVVNVSKPSIVTEISRELLLETDKLPEQEHTLSHVDKKFDSIEAKRSEEAIWSMFGTPTSRQVEGGASVLNKSQQSKSLRDQSVQIDRNRGNSDVPTGWKVSRYRSSSKSSSSTGSTNGLNQMKKSLLKQNSEKSNTKRTIFESLDVTSKGHLSGSKQFPDDPNKMEKGATQTSTPIKDRGSSVASDIFSDISIRERHSNSSRRNVILPEIVLPDQNNKHEESPAKSVRERSRVISELSYLKSLETDVQESEYEKFKKSIRRSSQVIKQNVSLENDLSLATVPTISGLNLNGSLNEDNRSQKVSSAHNASKKIEKPEQSTTSGRIDEKGSTVVIYKTVQGEQLILADDQQRNESDYETARDTSGSVMVIDDLRRFKTPIRTPTVPGGKALSLPLETVENRGKLRPSARSGSSNEGNARTGNKKCEQRKWRDILQNHQSPFSKQQQQTGSKPLIPLSGATTNDRITTINYEILDTRRRRSSGALKMVDAHDSCKKPLPVKPSTSSATGGKVNPSIECNYDPKAYVLNFKIKVPGSLKAKEQVINSNKK